MRLRDVAKLQTGDIITCRECPEEGCHGGEYTVDRIVEDICGDVYILLFHDGNSSEFAYAINGVWRWAPNEDQETPISGRSIKLVRKRDE